MLLTVAMLAACGEGPEAIDPTPAPPEAPTPPLEETEVVPEPTAEDEPTDPTVDPAADVLTEEDDGRRVGLGVGDEVALRLSNEWAWEQPRVEGAAIMLSPVDYLVDPGFVEWAVTGQEAGVAALTVEGEPACPDEASCPPLTVELTFEVDDS